MASLWAADGPASPSTTPARPNKSENQHLGSLAAPPKRRLSPPPFHIDNRDPMVICLEHLLHNSRKIDAKLASIDELSGPKVFRVNDPMVTEYAYGFKRASGNKTQGSVAYFHEDEGPVNAESTRDKSRMAWACLRYGEAHLWGQTIMAAEKKNCAVCGNTIDTNNRAQVKHLPWVMPENLYIINRFTHKGDAWKPRPLDAKDRLDRKRPWQHPIRAASDLYYQLIAAGLDEPTALAHVKIPFYGVGKLGHTPAFKAWLEDKIKEGDPSVDSDTEDKEYYNDDKEDEVEEGMLDRNNGNVHDTDKDDEGKEDQDEDVLLLDAPSRENGENLQSQMDQIEKSSREAWANRPEVPVSTFHENVAFVGLGVKHTDLDESQHQLLLEDIKRTIGQYRSRGKGVELEEQVETVASLLALLEDQDNLLGTYRNQHKGHPNIGRPVICLTKNQIRRAMEILSSEHYRGDMDIVYLVVWHDGGKPKHWE